MVTHGNCSTFVYKLEVLRFYIINFKINNRDKSLLNFNSINWHLYYCVGIMKEHAIHVELNKPIILIKIILKLHKVYSGI